MLDPESLFFCNGFGVGLGRIQNKPGSWLHKIGEVVGMKKLTLTDLRKAAEELIQDNEKLKKKANILNNHSKEVGANVYDAHRAPGIRAEFISQLEITEGGKKSQIERDATFERARQLRKKEMEEKDKVAKIKYAENVLIQEKQKRNENVGFSRRCRVTPNDR